MDESNAKKGFFQVKPGQTYSESSNTALLGLFYYSMLMFTLPLLSFFGTKHILVNHTDVSPTYVQFAPIIVSVIVVNLVIVCYVIKAFREEAKENKGTTSKDSHSKSE